MKTPVVLVYITFMMCDVKQVFICLRASYISFSVNYLFLSFPVYLLNSWLISYSFIELAAIFQ